MHFIYILITLLIGLQNKKPHTVMAEKGVNIRAHDSVDAKILKKVPFGTVFYSSVTYMMPQSEMEKNYKKDTINNNIGFWIDAELSKDNIRGYVFSPFVYYGESRIQNLNKDKFRFSEEGICCASLNFEPNLLWYGLYKVKNKLYLEKIKVDLLLSKCTHKDLFQDRIYPDMDAFYLLTNKKEKSKFMFGTKSPMEIGSISQIYQADINGTNGDNGFLYPEQNMKFYFNFLNYEINASELITLDSITLNVTKKYDIKFQIFDNDYNHLSTYHFIKDLDQSHNAKKHAQFQTPKVYWVGDLNKDGALDIILLENFMSEGCGGCFKYSLYLSSIGEDGTISLKYTDFLDSCNC